MPTLTINTTAGQASRAASAVGVELGLRGSDGAQRDATPAEVKDWLIRQMRKLVHAHEIKVAQAALQSPSAFDPT